MWVKWYRSKTAWVIIITAVVAMVGAFLCAYYLPFPWNSIGAFLTCVPSGVIMRIAIVKKVKSKFQEIEKRLNNENNS